MRICAKYLTLKELHNLNLLLPDRAWIENSTEALKKSSKKLRNIEARGRVLRAQYVSKFKKAQRHCQDRSTRVS